MITIAAGEAGPSPASSARRGETRIRSGGRTQKCSLVDKILTGHYGRHPLLNAFAAPDVKVVIVLCIGMARPIIKITCR